MLWPYHLGSLHPLEQLITIVLAFGPFLVLGAVILVRRRRDRMEGERDGEGGTQPGSRPDAPSDTWSDAPSDTQRDK